MEWRLQEKQEENYWKSNLVPRKAYIGNDNQFNLFDSLPIRSLVAICMELGDVAWLFTGSNPTLDASDNGINSCVQHILSWRFGHENISIIIHPV